MSRAHLLYSPLLVETPVSQASRCSSGVRLLCLDPTWSAFGLAYTLALAVLMLDVALPLWVSVPVLYIVPPAYLAWRTQLSRMTGLYPLALTCTVLTVAAWSLPPEQIWTAMPNRLMAITVVWIVTVLWPQHQEEDGESEVLQGLFSIGITARRSAMVRDLGNAWRAMCPPTRRSALVMGYVLTMDGSTSRASLRGQRRSVIGPSPTTEHEEGASACR
jgi:hypothetical protein